MKDLIISDDDMFYDMLYDFVYDGINIEKRFKSFIYGTMMIHHEKYLGGIVGYRRVNKYIYPFVCNLVHMCLDKGTFINYMKKLSEINPKEFIDDHDKKRYSLSVAKKILGNDNLGCSEYIHSFGVCDFYDKDGDLSNIDFVKHSLIKAAAVYYFIYASKHTVKEGIFCEEESKFLDIMDNYKNLVMENEEVISKLIGMDVIQTIHSFPEYFYENIYMPVLYLYKEIYKRKLFPFKVISSMEGSWKFIDDNYSKHKFRNFEIKKSLDLIPYVERCLMCAQGFE